jgi:hypothetical protein
MAGQGGTRGARDIPETAIRVRARRFAFEGFPEKDRFGVFDPALRGWFVFAFMLAATLAAFEVVDAWGRTASAWGLSALLMTLIGGAGALLYRRIWRRPAERELLLRMAAEDDESRALRAKLARQRAAALSEASAQGLQGTGPQKDRPGEEPRKAF